MRLICCHAGQLETDLSQLRDVKIGRRADSRTRRLLQQHTITEVHSSLLLVLPVGTCAIACGNKRKDVNRDGSSVHRGRQSQAGTAGLVQNGLKTIAIKCHLKSLLAHNRK